MDHEARCLALQAADEAPLLIGLKSADQTGLRVRAPSAAFVTEGAPVANERASRFGRGEAHWVRRCSCQPSHTTTVRRLRAGAPDCHAVALLCSNDSAQPSLPSTGIEPRLAQLSVAVTMPIERSCA